jgi:hypothetical protein
MVTGNFDHSGKCMLRFHHSYYLVFERFVVIDLSTFAFVNPGLEGELLQQTSIAE